MSRIALLFVLVVSALSLRSEPSIARVDNVLRPGDPVRPLLVAGVLEKDCGTERDAKAFAAFANGASQELSAVKPCEFDDFTVQGMSGRWQMCMTPPPVYAAGTYNVTERFALMPVCATLVSERTQKAVLRLHSQTTPVLLNGRKVCDTSTLAYVSVERNCGKRDDKGPKVTWYTPRKYMFEHGGQWRNRPTGDSADASRDVRLQLEAGTNTVMFLPSSFGRQTGMQFRLELASCEAPVRAVLPCRIPPAVREAIARSQAETHMVDDRWMPGETPVLHVGPVDGGACSVAVSLSPGGKPAATGPLEPDAAGDVRMPGLAAGLHFVDVEWKGADGRRLVSSRFEFTVVKPIPPDPGPERFAARRQAQLERLAAGGSPLALYRLRRYGEIRQEKIDELCRRVDRRADCADFDLLPLLWLAHEDRLARRLPDAVHERIRKAALGFRYWVDEGGSSSMFYCSENHRIGFHVCEYVTGLLYPQDMFSNSGQNGLFHSLKGRMLLMEWLDQRCRFGFDEPLSDAYMPVTMSALLALRETLPPEEYAMHNMVNILLDFMTYQFAATSFCGTLASARSRSYNPGLRTRFFSVSDATIWALFGNAPGHGCDPSLAFSLYMPPAGLLAVADDMRPLEYSMKQGLMHFDKRNVDFTFRRTKDYMISAAREHNVGFCDMHFMPAYIALRNDVSVFFQAPNNCAEGHGQRPDYWAGQAYMPRVLHARRTLAVVWHDVPDSAIRFTHCHFNRRRFDEVVERGGWTFGRAGDGYVGIWSDKPHGFRREGAYAGRELVCDGREVVWLAECGRKEEDGSFEDFVDRIASMPVRRDGDRVSFRSPFSGLFEFGLSDGFALDGKPVPIPQMLSDSPWLKSRYGSGRFDYTCPGFAETQWSNGACE